MVAHSYIYLSEIILYKKMDNVGPFFPKFGKIDILLKIGLCHCFVFIDPNYIQETKKTNAPVLEKLRPWWTDSWRDPNFNRIQIR